MQLEHGPVRLLAVDHGEPPGLRSRLVDRQGPLVALHGALHAQVRCGVSGAGLDEDDVVTTVQR